MAQILDLQELEALDYEDGLNGPSTASVTVCKDQSTYSVAVC